jgi:hypothetical protein
MFVATGMTFFVMFTARDISYADGKLLGGFFIALGLMNSLSCEATSRKLFSKTQSSPPFVAKVGAHIGEKGLQTLYLGIGVILALAGAVVILVSRASKY